MVREFDQIIEIDMASQAAAGLKRVFPQGAAHKIVAVGPSTLVLPDGEPVPEGGIVTTEYSEGEVMGGRPVHYNHSPRIDLEPGDYNQIHDHASPSSYNGVPMRLEAVSK